MIVVVASIPHTGTQFVWNQILGGFETRTRSPRESHGKIWIHLYPELLTELNRFEGYPCIVPLRHPLAVGASWKGRGESLEELVDLFALCGEIQEPLYMPIDAANRETFLGRISERIGMTLVTDWANTTSSSSYRGELTHQERASLAPCVEFYESICRGT